MCALREPLGDIDRIGMYALSFITLLFRIHLILLLSLLLLLLLLLLLFGILYCDH